jgi:hypothetical protein
VAEALAIVRLPFVHVSRVPSMGSAVVGRSPTPDEVIAKWCAATGRVLVTCDEDFRGRWVRSGLLCKHGVEVIVFEKELAGLEEQHHRVTMHYPWWQLTLRNTSRLTGYGFRAVGVLLGSRRSRSQLLRTPGNRTLIHPSVR